MGSFNRGEVFRFFKARVVELRFFVDFGFLLRFSFIL